MTFNSLQSIVQKTVIFILFISTFQNTFCQKQDSIEVTRTFSGNVSVTNNGFSNIPTFSLGKPAIIFNLVAAGKRSSFEPEIRFSLEGKPWSFLFWFRQKLVLKPKYQMTYGMHPGLNFRYQNAVINGVESTYTIERLYITQELNQNIPITKNFSTGLYYSYGHGVDVGTTKHTHYLSLRAAFSNIKIVKDVSMKINPQLFFLNTGYKNGTYFASNFGLYKKNWPVWIGGIINKKLKSDIVSKDFNWNISLNYMFGGNYIPIATP
jgi:hypothetical protein